MNTEQQIRATCRHVERMLIAKHRSYGCSALQPIRIFAKGDAETLLRARLDDKLSRIRNAPAAFGEDELLDATGYMILLLTLRSQSKRRTRIKAS